ncbi:hypothetical protein [Aquabacterium sp.]|uniref:hypothetical protein n=1 Tax=Aquabacterium sp. TaxID=1872578 RepID=UPI002E32B8E0|nr:hypothetical protein [Aquabacterium sp.]HEX5312390.1 hypothetical protein [Aquabacterium sp.]
MHIDRLLAFVPVLGAWVLLAVSSGGAWAAPDEVRQPTHQEASDCAAAFEGRILQRRTEPRTDTRNQAILRDAELGFTFVAVAYKQGLRNPEADQMLKASEKRWATLTEAERRKRLAQCSTWSQQLFDEFNGFERYLVQNRAQARVDRLLKKEAAAATVRPSAVKPTVPAVAPASAASASAVPASAPPSAPASSALPDPAASHSPSSAASELN